MSGINCLFLVCVLCICNFFKFYNYSLCFLCKLFTCPNEEHCLRLIRGYEAFKETNFTHIFLFVICDVYVTTVSSLTKKLCLCFEKCYDFFLSLIAVFNKPPRNKRLIPIRGGISVTSTSNWLQGMSYVCMLPGRNTAINGKRSVMYQR